MKNTDLKRISRLTAIVTQLQSKRLSTATELSKKFNVSIRTIYRDIKALEQAGVPVLIEDGKGYVLMHGYKIPPVMFTEGEANALVTAERLIFKSSDITLRNEYSAAISKIKAVLQYSAMEKAELLSNRIAISPAISIGSGSNSLSLIQSALTSFNALEIVYNSAHRNETTTRIVEPFALYFSLEESWLLIAFCRLRNDFRMFSLERTRSIKLLDLHFEPHKITLAEYLRDKQEKFSKQ